MKMKRFARILAWALCLACLFPAASAEGVLTLPESVRRIEAEAFRGASMILEVILSSYVKSIGPKAFADSGLQRIYLPDSVTEIADDAFENTNAVGWGNPDNYAEAWCGENGMVYEALSTPIGEFTFSFPTEDTATVTGWNGEGESVIIPAMADDTHAVTAIGASAFYGKKALKTVHLPRTLTVIGNQAFQNCESLTEINFPDGLETIKYSAFYGCASLTAAPLPDTVTTIEGFAFDNCPALAAFRYPAGLTLGNSLLNDSPLITEITIPEGVTALPDNLFNGNEHIKKVTLPGTLTVIKNQAFRDCKNLSEINFPDGLETIKYGAFNGCASLTAAPLPDTVTAIEGFAFSNCPALAAFHYPAGLTLANGLLNGSPLITEITIPEGVTALPVNLFYGNGHIKKVTLPGTLTIINNQAFRDCKNLAEINLPPVLKTLKYGAFNGCEALAALYVPSAVKTIESTVFDNCPSLTVEGEKGSKIIDYCQSNGIPYTVRGGSGGSGGEIVIPGDYGEKVNAFLNNPDFADGAPYGDGQQTKSYTSSNCWSCYAYTADFVHEVWPVPAGTTDFRPAHIPTAVKFTSVSEIRDGDVIYLSNGSEDHYYVVLKRNDDGSLWTAEGNCSQKVCVSTTAYSISNPNAGNKTFRYGWHMPQ